MDSDKKAIIEDMEIEMEVPEAERFRNITRIHLVIIPIIFFLFVAHGIFYMIFEEWLRATVQHEYFPDTEVRSNFSTCDIVNKSNQDYLNYMTVQQKSAHWMMYFRYADSVPAVVMSLVLPSYSDSLGRKKILLVSIFGICVWVCGTTIIMFAKASLYYVVFFYVCRGLTGSTHGLTSILFSYVADITRGDNQPAQGIILLDIFLVVCGLVASPMSGVLVQTLGLGFRNTGAICSSLVALTVLLTSLVLPETLPKTRRQPILSFSMALKQPIAFFTSGNFRGNKLPFVTLMLVFFFNELSIASRNSLEILYLLGQPFCWGPSYIGYYGLVYRASTSILGLAAVKVMLKFFSSCTISLLSCISNASSLVMESLARVDAVMYCSPLVGLLGFLIFPLIRSMMSLMASPEVQGSMFASLGAIQAIGSLVSVLENEIYTATLTIMNGFVFLCLAMFVGVEILLLLLFRCIKPHEKDQNRINRDENTVKA